MRSSGAARKREVSDLPDLRGTVSPKGHCKPHLAVNPPAQKAKLTERRPTRCGLT